MSVTIPDDVLQAARMSAAELLQEIAVMLFQLINLAAIG